LAPFQNQRGLVGAIAIFTVVAVYAFQINEASFNAFSQGKVQGLIEKGQIPDLSSDLEWSNRYWAYGLTNQLIAVLWLSGVSWAGYRIRALRRLRSQSVVRLLALIAAGILVGCQAQPAKDLTVAVAAGLIEFPADGWRPMTNEFAFARNFEALINKPPRQYQTVTVFLNQMTTDQRSGREIAPSEYLEIFLSNPNEITVLLRRDHGAYWLLSREMFRGVRVGGIDLGSTKPLSTIEEGKIFGELRGQIDSTRYLLAEGLNAR